MIDHKPKFVLDNGDHMKNYIYIYNRQSVWVDGDFEFIRIQKLKYTRDKVESIKTKKWLPIL